MTTQEFRVADQVRLEVQADDVATTNLVRNGVPALGTYLWSSYDTTSKFEANYDQPILPQFRHTAVSTSSSEVSYARINVTPGQYLGVSANFTLRQANTETATILVSVYRANGTVLIPPTEVATATWSGLRTYGTPLLMPANAATALVTSRTSTTAASAAGRYVQFTNVAARLGATAAAVTNLEYSEPYEWRDVLGKTGSIKAVHDGIALGTLTATLYDSTLDPAASTALRSGRLVRLTALDATGRWQSVWRGTLLKGSAVYDLTQRDPERRARITISAVNGVAQAANLNRPKGVATIAELAFLLEGASVPWAVNGNGTQPFGTPTYVTTDPKKTLLDQVAVTRDSTSGYAWVDRRGVLNVAAAASRPTALAATLTEDDYTALSYDYDTDRCINELNVKALRTGTDGTTGEVIFGPYRDQTSIDLNGAHSRDVTVQGLTDAQIATYAAAVLAANATPVRKINSLRFPVLSVANLTAVDGTKRALIDTYDRVRVTNADGVDQTLRPTTITHTLTAGVRTDKWTVDVEFASDAGAAAPISVPAPPGPTVAAGSTDGTWQLPTLRAGWADYDPPTFANEKPAFKREGKTVRIVGLMKFVSGSDPVPFIVPDGYRPTRSTFRFCVINGAPAVCQVTAAGAVSIVTGITAANSWVSLDIEYDTNQP